MKPRLRKIYSMWFCRCDAVTGLGYTAAQAFDDWADLTRKYTREGLIELARHYRSEARKLRK